jgi:uroporphyrinogen-III synthase
MTRALPFAGRTVVLTRPAGQAAGLAGEVEARGGQALNFPVIEIAPPADTTELAAASARLEDYDLAFFVSRNAVEQALSFILARRQWPAAVRVATVGKGSQRCLEGYGFEQVIAPREGFDSEAVLALPAFQPGSMNGAQVLIFRGDGGRELLGDTLRLRGARVDYVACYTRRIPAIDRELLLEPARRGGVDVLVLTSSEGVDNLLHMLAPQGAGVMRSIPLLASHPRIAQRARDAGFATVLLAEPGDAGILAGLERLFKCDPSARLG